MTLDKLPLGQEAVITAVGGEGALRCRLLDMGLIPKTKVRIEKIAPLGDPLELRVRGYSPVSYTHLTLPTTSRV